MAIDIMRSLSGRPKTLYPYQTSYGKPQYEEAVGDWRKMMGNYAQMMGGVTPKLGKMMDYYKPGGGYGAGRREEAKETVQSGMARDLGSMVSTGMSSQFGARGTGTRASSELSKLYKNIEDTRSQLWQQSVQPYAQIMQQMAQMQAVRPTYGQYFKTGAALKPTVTPSYT